MKKTKRILSKMLALMLTVMLSVGMFSSLGFSVDEKAPVGPHDAGVSSRLLYGTWKVPECSGFCYWNEFENGGHKRVSIHMTQPSVPMWQGWPFWLEWTVTQEDSYKHRHCTKAYSDVHGGPYCVAAHDPVPCPKCGKCTQCTGPDDCKCNTCPLCNKKYDQCTCKPPESTIKFSPSPNTKTYTAPDGKVYYRGDVQLDIVNANATGMTLRQIERGEGVGLNPITPVNINVISSVQSDRQLTQMYRAYYNGKYELTISNDNPNHTTTVQTFLVTGIDVYRPSVSVVSNPTNWTNQDRQITVKGWDREDLTSNFSSKSGIKEFQLINKDTVATTPTTENAEKVISVPTNGGYHIDAVDNVGNRGSIGVPVTHIDKIKPVVGDIQVTPLPTPINSRSRRIVDNKQVEISLTATDAETKTGELSDRSGVNRIEYQIVSGNGPVQSNGWKTYTASSKPKITDEFVGNVFVRAFDNAGNVSEQKSTSVMLEGTAPTINVTSSNTNLTNKDVTLNVACADGGRVVSGVKEITLPDSSVVNTTTSQYTATQNGSYLFKVEDNAGNKVTTTFTVSNIDKTNPTGKITYDNKPTNKDVVLTYESQDAQSGLLSIKLPDGSTNTIGSGDNSRLNTVTYTITENGSYSFVSTDVTGNITTKTVDVTNIDKTVPVATHNVDNSYTSGYVVIEMTVSDEGDTVYPASGVLNTVCPDKSVKTDGNFNYSVNKNGDYDFIVTDKAGNKITHTVKITSVDTTSPTLTHRLNTIDWTGKDVTITVDLEDMQSALKEIKTPDGKITKFDKANQKTGTTNYVVSQNGSYEFIAKDNVDNETKYTVKVDNIDKTGSDVNGEVSNKKWTNSDVSLILKLKDDASGEGKVLAPDKKYYDIDTGEEIAEDELVKSPMSAKGLARANSLKPINNSNSNSDTEKPADKEFNFTVDMNGSYPFVVYDKVGNETPITVDVGNIDKVKPTITVTNSNGSVPCGETALQVVTSDDASGIQAVVLPDGKTTREKNPTYSVNKNGEYTFYVVDNAGNDKRFDIKVDNIDTEIPTKPVITNSSVEYKNVKGEYVLDWSCEAVNLVIKSEAASGIAKYLYKTEKGEWKELKNASLMVKTEGEQEISVKAESKAGKESEVVKIQVNNDFTKPTAEFKETKTGLSVEADDKLSGIKSIECDCGKTEGGHKTCALSAGNHNHKYTITDNAGNVLVTEKEITIKAVDVTNGNGDDNQNLTSISDEKVPLSLGKKMAIVFSAFALIVLLILLIMYVVYKTYKRKKEKAETK